MAPVATKRREHGDGADVSVECAVGLFLIRDRDDKFGAVFGPRRR
jgi:hypothetical protein